MNSDFSNISPIRDSRQSRDSLRSLLKGLGSKETLPSPVDNTPDNQLLEVISEKRPFDEASSAARRDSNYIQNIQDYGGGLMTPTISKSNNPLQLTLHNMTSLESRKRDRSDSLNDKFSEKMNESKDISLKDLSLAKSNPLEKKLSLKRMIK